jgi:hypothetical protein
MNIFIGDDPLAGGGRSGNNRSSEDMMNPVLHTSFSSRRESVVRDGSTSEDGFGIRSSADSSIEHPRRVSDGTLDNRHVSPGPYHPQTTNHRIPPQPLFGVLSPSAYGLNFSSISGTNIGGPGGHQDEHHIHGSEDIGSRNVGQPPTQTLDQPANSSGRSQMAILSGSHVLDDSRRRDLREQLVDYELGQNFNSTSPEIPERLVNGGIICARPEFSEVPNTKGKEKENDITGVAPPIDGGEDEEVDEKEQAFRDGVQRTIEEDERRIKVDMQLSQNSFGAKPTAKDAEKARHGMSKEDFAKQMQIDLNKLEENEIILDVVEKTRSSISEEDIVGSGIELGVHSLVVQSEPLGQDSQLLVLEKQEVKQVKARRGFFSSLGNYPEVIMELAKHCRPKDFVNIYSISKDFHEIVNSYLSHNMLATSMEQAPESASVFKFKFYGNLCVPDPAGRSHPKKAGEVRMVPGPRWLQMVVHREKTIRDILALMARQGHRMPKDMSLSLKKMWLIMDVSTSAHRVQLFHSPYFTDKDIFNMQMFFVKLDMRFNDPIDGPGNDSLRKLMLGQRGLTPLCKLLKREIGLTPVEVIEMGIRYACHVQPQFRGLPLFDIPPEVIGVGHLEGWGKGKSHLLRPDELVVREAVKRRLGLKNHIMGMMLWGYVDPVTAQNIPVTEEEKYISEEEENIDSSSSDDNSDVRDGSGEMKEAVGNETGESSAMVMGATRDFERLGLPE